MVRRVCTVSETMSGVGGCYVSGVLCLVPHSRLLVVMGMGSRMCAFSQPKNGAL